MVSRTANRNWNGVPLSYFWSSCFPLPINGIKYVGSEVLHLSFHDSSDFALRRALSQHSTQYSSSVLNLLFSAYRTSPHSLVRKRSNRNQTQKQKLTCTSASFRAICPRIAYVDAPEYTFWDDDGHSKRNKSKPNMLVWGACSIFKGGNVIKIEEFN